MIPNNCCGVGTELGGLPIVGGRCLAQRYGTLLIQIAPTQIAHPLIRVDEQADGFVYEGEVFFHENLLIRS